LDGSLADLNKGRTIVDMNKDPDEGKDKFVIEAVKIAKKACWRRKQNKEQEV